MDFKFKTHSFSEYVTAITKIDNITHEQFLNKKEFDDFIFNLLETAIGEIDHDTHSRFLESIKNEVGRAGFNLIQEDELSEIKGSLEEKDNHIKQLEAQISRDRESLIKEGEFAKKYLGNQREWISQ